MNHVKIIMNIVNLLNYMLTIAAHSIKTIGDYEGFFHKKLFPSSDRILEHSKLTPETSKKLISFLSTMESKNVSILIRKESRNADPVKDRKIFKTIYDDFTNKHFLRPTYWNEIRLSLLGNVPEYGVIEITVTTKSEKDLNAFEKIAEIIHMNMINGYHACMKDLANGVNNLMESVYPNNLNPFFEKERNEKKDKRAADEFESVGDSEADPDLKLEDLLSIGNQLFGSKFSSDIAELVKRGHAEKKKSRFEVIDEIDLPGLGKVVVAGIRK